MNLPATVFSLRWLVRDTFRQSLASGVFWLMLGVSAVCTAVCASVRVVGDTPRAPGHGPTEALPRSDVMAAARAAADLVPCAAAQAHGAWLLPRTVFSREYHQVERARRTGVLLGHGRLELAFGSIRVEISRDRAHTVRTIQMHLAVWVADGAGLLLALMWTAGFLPSFLAPDAVSVLLAKPVPRWALLAGKFVGVLAFVGFQALVFVGGTWLALALRTGVWDPAYFLCVPLLLLHFGVFFSFSLMLAVATRSTVACVFGSTLFWLLCWLLNFGRHSALLVEDLHGMGPVLGHALEFGYWVLPKPLDFHLLLMDSLHGEHFFAPVLNQSLLVERGGWAPEGSVLSSVACAAVLLAISARDFMLADY